MITTSPRVPGRTPEECQANLRVITVVSLVYFGLTITGTVHYDRRSRAESRFLEMLYYRVKWRELRNGGGPVQGRRLVLGL